MPCRSPARRARRSAFPAASCVPYNIFADGGVTPDAVAYLETLGTAAGSTELRTFHADATGDLGVYGLKLPTAERRRGRQRRL